MANGDYKIVFERLEQIIMLTSGNRPVDGMRLYYSIVGLGSFFVDMEQTQFSPDAIREKARAQAEDFIKTLKG